MSKVIKNKEVEFNTTCPICKSTFNYELDDLISPAFVSCPMCGSACDHKGHIVKHKTNHKKNINDKRRWSFDEDDY